MNFNLFPWDSNEQPFWINPENGLLWYIDKETTKWCSRGSILPKLDAICFYVCEKNNEKIKVITRILIDKKTNKVLADDQSLEQMAVKIDAIRMSRKIYE